ncbi:AfsR/SARP family transcriptional regulator [Nonomuraea rubra]|uniref:DNA-binding SARP family transcriptional activator n=1 Tax=Nonomuraea rubra TaxID=46180 RepID=A0A7X0NLH9_9ACTN|nr:BTAD domain-containing putative transcriptional regulator [Nonomuraea rubra]MBB6545662.1 DNA-binding SARP family transcriptional activator [Nonomuraea rubra]
MRVGILGPLRVAGSELGGARVRALLVRLALDPGRVVTAGRLIDDLWPDEPPAHPAAALQSLVSRARRQAPGLIASHPAGYLLDVPPGEVDAQALERLVREGDVRAALALWRGPALADAAGLPFAAGPAARLEELRLTALATRLAADLDETPAGQSRARRPSARGRAAGGRAGAARDR